MENSITVVYLRHGHKLYSNNKHFTENQYPFDPPLHKKHLHQIHTKKKLLVDNFGEFSNCICSPYKRTRDTAGIIYNGKVINIDTNISEFLGKYNNFSNIQNLVEDITKSYDIQNFLETQDQLKERLNKHIDNIGLKDLNINEKYLKNNGCNILVVSHGTLIRNIYYLLTGNTIDRPKELCGFYVKGKKGQIVEIGLID
jgi:broad specificity phosphatase PhoE